MLFTNSLFFAKKTAAESHRLLVELYDEHAPTKTQCFESGFNALKVVIFTSNTTSILDSRKCLKINNQKRYSMKIRVKTTRRSCGIIGHDSSSHFQALKSIGIHPKARELSATRVEGKRRGKAILPCLKYCSSVVIGRSRFCKRIFNDDERWPHYDNPKLNKSYVKHGQSAKSTLKWNIYGSKV